MGIYCGIDPKQPRIKNLLSRDIEFRKPEQRGYRVSFFNTLEAMLTQTARKVDVFEDVDERHRQQRALLKRKTLESRAARRIEKK
ncbi:hypothetical protein VK98_20820 [Chromobacterium sp. LK11]|nr:hypothetical protein VK98_20820 [Chromobacterium sp. LK11]